MVVIFLRGWRGLIRRGRSFDRLMGLCIVFHESWLGGRYEARPLGAGVEYCLGLEWLIPNIELSSSFFLCCIFVQPHLRLVLVILEMESQLHSVASHAFAGKQKGSQGQIFQMMRGEWNLLFHFSHSTKHLPLNEAKRQILSGYASNPLPILILLNTDFTKPRESKLRPTDECSEFQGTTKGD